MTTPKITTAQLDYLMTLQFELYKAQGDYGIAEDCKATMDAAQKVMRSLAPAATPAPTPPPAPAPVDPFADLKFRLYEIGSWAAYCPAFFNQSNELIAAYPEQQRTIQDILAYYGPGGYGNVHGRREENDFFYVDILTQEWLPDINGAADDMILNQPGNPNHVPPPVFVF